MRVEISGCKYKCGVELMTERLRRAADCLLVTSCGTPVSSPFNIYNHITNFNAYEDIMQQNIERRFAHSDFDKGFSLRDYYYYYLALLLSSISTLMRLMYSVGWQRLGYSSHPVSCSEERPLNINSSQARISNCLECSRRDIEVIRRASDTYVAT
jgi:hypothetical protein